MNETTSKQALLDTGASKMLATQSLLVAGMGWGFYAFQGILAAQAALYGGCMVMFNVWITNRRLHQAAEVAKIAPGKEIRIFYFAAVQRFVFTISFFIIGMGLLNLPPIPMVVAFAVAHLGYFLKN
ncbi:ATP synthase subunit I [Candidatus Parabeggiatoa sp. HSG14]|uniref:ATP synthase subunit I n=1 Tax=Candidatus Parabeggiatoa sp. HSG14 TaxID=3055593 RepID=UPI0025A82DB4|nr:ATP synthase subunit I [Thiotrichales bacterium HSG14]